MSVFRVHAVYGPSWYSKHRWRKFGTLIPALIAKENQAGSYMRVTGNKITVFPRIIAWGDYKFFAPKRRDYSREVVISYHALLAGSRALNILLYYPITPQK